MAWLIAPPVEELAKALPVIVLAFLTREARRLSIADLTLIGFASGAGFGFVEGNLNALVNGTLPGFAILRHWDFRPAMAACSSPAMRSQPRWSDSPPASGCGSFR